MQLARAASSSLHRSLATAAAVIAGREDRVCQIRPNLAACGRRRACMYPGTSLRLAWGSSGRWHVIEQQQQEQAPRQLCDQATRRRCAGQIIRSDSTRELRRVDGQRPVRLGVTSRPSKPAGHGRGRRASGAPAGASSVHLRARLCQLPPAPSSSSLLTHRSKYLFTSNHLHHTPSHPSHHHQYTRHHDRGSRASAGQRAVGEDLGHAAAHRRSLAARVPDRQRDGREDPLVSAIHTAEASQRAKSRCRCHSGFERPLSGTQLPGSKLRNAQRNVPRSAR